LEDEGITDIFFFFFLCDQDIADIPLSISDKQLLFIFRSFHLHQQLHGHSVHQMIAVTQGEFEDFKEGPNCPVIPSLLMESLPMPAYSLNDPVVMDHPLSSRSEADVESGDLPASSILAEAKFLLSSSPVELQVMHNLLVPAPFLDMDSATMVVDLAPMALDPVIRDPCQSIVNDISDPCIELLGGEMLPSQLPSLSA